MTKELAIAQVAIKLEQVEQLLKEVQDLSLEHNFGVDYHGYILKDVAESIGYDEGWINSNC